MVSNGLWEIQQNLEARKTQVIQTQNAKGHEIYSYLLSFQTLKPVLTKLTIPMPSTENIRALIRILRILKPGIKHP